jgi:hypothetical protein
MPNKDKEPETNNNKINVKVPIGIETFILSMLKEAKPPFKNICKAFCICL